MDGSALAYRSHFAFISNPLTNSRGMATGAVFGFTTTLLRLLEKEKPDHIAVVFDSPEPTFRHQEFPAYKATREKMPDEMADQLPYIRRVVEAMRIPFLAMPTFEADDIIGTLAKQAARKEIEVFMVTGDKDFLQLLGPGIRMYQMKKGGEIEILQEDAPMKRWGVPAKHVTDILALMGDSSDNVPGVPGIGEKTAMKLIQQFGSVEDLYASLDKVTPDKVREKLAANREQAELCKRLVTIHENVPVPIDVDDLELRSPDLPRLRELYQELDFHSLIDSLASVGGKTTEENSYVRVETEKDLEKLSRTLRGSKEFAFDTETTSLNELDAKPVGLSFSAAEGKAFFVPLHISGLSPATVWEHLKPILEDPKRPKGGQNTKYDCAVLKNVGINVQGVSFDTMVESYLLDPEARQHGLDALALRYLGIQKIPTAELIGKGESQISMLDVDVDRLTRYACEDADVTYRLHTLFTPQIEHQELKHLYQEVELPLIEVLGDMERTGIAVDTAKLKELSIRLTQRLEELTREIHKLAGEEFNIASPKQLGPILFEKLKIQENSGVRRVKKTKTGYATDQETLEAYISHPVVAKLIEHRNLSKLLSTYIESLPTLIHPKTGRIHTSFNQTVTATGRLSSSDPNLQNIPIRTDLGREIRRAFIPGEKGWKLFSADYSQIELRLLAHLAKDKTLIETFQRGDDVHRTTASLIFDVPLNKVTSELRSRAKAINFGVIYGMGPQRLARETGISMEEAKAFIEAYFEKYANVRAYLDSQIEKAKERGFVTTLLGRRREIADIRSSNPRFASNAERIAVNTPIQGSAADLIKVAMVRIHRSLKEKPLRARMLIQVHDELVFEVHPDDVSSLTALVRKEMENAIELIVPIVVDVGVGDNWADAH
ncbi:MAG: DNA polymerase I [Pseudomonadota bacterium]